MTAGLILCVYLAGLFLVAACAFGAAASEPTAHGQSIIVPIGCMFALFWPLGLLWFAFVAAYLVGAWLVRRVCALGRCWP